MNTQDDSGKIPALPKWGGVFLETRPSQRFATPLGRDLFALFADPTEFHRPTQEQLAEVLEGEPQPTLTTEDINRMAAADEMGRLSQIQKNDWRGTPHEL